MITVSSRDMPRVQLLDQSRTDCLGLSPLQWQEQGRDDDPA